MSLLSAIYWGAFTLVLLIAPLITRLICKKGKLEKQNFRGEAIPAVVGITPLLVGLCGYAIEGKWPLFLCVLAFGTLGFCDDKWGDRSVGGFRGHLGALRGGKLTTGAIKLLGGGIAALVCAYLVDGLRLMLPLDAMLIALAANTINLLDLRPGRALFAFFCLATPVAFARPDLIISPLLGALREVLADTQGKAMLGDTGANLLGAVAGLALVVAMPAWARLLILALLITLNLVAERVSLSQKIQTTPWLRWIDSKLGVR
jgi:UDP-GlcNAc:undecaprenyl-phosphate/decaprenyl-phosphate GlcNAc-1-phosphate transferase